MTEGKLNLHILLGDKLHIARIIINYGMAYLYPP